MKKLSNIKNTMFEVGQLLVKNENIVKLLYNDSQTALTDAVPSVSYEELLDKEYICSYPPVETASLEQATRNTFIAILLDSLDYTLSDNNIEATLEILVSTDNHHLKLQPNKNRLFELIDEVVKTLDGVKLSAAGALSIRYVNLITVSDFRQVYRLRFKFSDQTDKKAEI